MASTRTTFTLDDRLAAMARELGINISAAARDGVDAAVREALAEADREAYRRRPEESSSPLAALQVWSDE